MNAGDTTQDKPSYYLQKSKRATPQQFHEGRAKASFAILRSALLCLRGSRTPRRRNLVIKDSDLEIEKDQAGLP